MVNKDFLKEVLAGEKVLLKKAEVATIEVPHYDELSVRSLWPEFKKDADFMRHFPSTYPKGKGPPRDYFFNVLNTLQPEYLAKVMAHANEQRMSSAGEGNKAESIKISEFWEEQLKAMPYLSCKFSPFSSVLTFLSCLQRRAARPFTSSRAAQSRRAASRRGRWCHCSAPSPSTRTPRRSPSRASNNSRRRRHSRNLRSRSRSQPWLQSLLPRASQPLWTSSCRLRHRTRTHRARTTSGNGNEELSYL